MNFDSLYNPYQSKRTTIYAKNGMVATSQPLASEAGLEMLKKGGNAIDAAIATAACLTVVEPPSNGIGGDAFAIVWVKDKIYGLNSSGPAPAGLSIDGVKKLGYDKMPRYGWLPVTVPGVPAAWAALSKRFGRLPFAELFEPAIRYAEEGFPVSPVLAKYWDTKGKEYDDLEPDLLQNWKDLFMIDGKPPKAGEIWKSQGHADTLRSIAETKAESFYRGELAQKIGQYAQASGGYLSVDDLAAFEPEWVDPISINYRGYDVWEMPPNGQGINTLIALNILKEYKSLQLDSIDTLHKQIEAMKLAFTDGKYYTTDPKYMEEGIVEELLSDSYAAERRKLIGDTAITPSVVRPQSVGTVYLATADGEGNMVSFIQSNYDGFGSGVVIPGTGISMQNRGADFSLNPSDPNVLAPGKRSYHTIIPGFLTKDGNAVGPFGVMGSFMQPQGHLQVVMSIVDFDLNPQAALDARRWRWIDDKKVKVEPDFPDHLAQGLVRKGHHIEKTLDEDGFGRGQIILRDPETGVLMGGTESRTDANIACW